MKKGTSPSPSPLLHRAQVNVRAVMKTSDLVDGNTKSSPPTSPQLGKVIIRAAKSPERAASPDYVRTPATVVSPTCLSSPYKQVRGAYVNVQGDEGKMPSEPSTQHNDCTSTGRLEGTQSSGDHLRPSIDVNKTRSQLLSGRGNHRSFNPKTRYLTSRIYTKPLRDKPRTSLISSCDPSSNITKDENYPPEKVDNHLKSETKCNVSLNQSNEKNINQIDTPLSRNQRKVFNPNSRLNYEKSHGFCHLKPSGTTPKLCRKLLESDLDTPNFFRKVIRPDDKENGKIQNGITRIDEYAGTSNFDSLDEYISLNSQNSDNSNHNSLASESNSQILDSLISDTSDSNSQNSEIIHSKSNKSGRKIKRSESYRMANSPIMFIKKFANHSEKSPKIIRTPSEEIQEELLKERINYPDSVSSPEPQIDNDFEVNLVTCPFPTIPTSPRPRALDLEPVKVLQYSGNDTEIW